MLIHDFSFHQYQLHQGNDGYFLKELAVFGTSNPVLQLEQSLQFIYATTKDEVNERV